MLVTSTLATRYLIVQRMLENIDSMGRYPYDLMDSRSYLTLEYALLQVPATVLESKFDRDTRVSQKEVPQRA